MKVSGTCHCGQISFEAEIDPGQVRICHCTDCQKLTGSAFRTNVASLPGTFRFNSGTPLYAAAPEANPSTVGLRVGALDQRSELRPVRQGWCRSALPWSMDITALPRAERQ